MSLDWLKVEAFRCFDRAELTLDPHYNLILGPNASGKTSLLEALYFLGRVRPLRGRRTGPLIKDDASAFELVGNVAERGRTVVLGVRASAAGTELHVGGARAESAAELARHFAPQVIDPEVHRLLEDGPARRRRYLDWGVFHVEQTFLGTWQRYYRALKQRNALLRRGAAETELGAWDEELEAAGEALAGLRAEYLRSLEPRVTALGRLLLDRRIEIHASRGWSSDTSLAEALTSHRDRDRRLAATQAGPHRADLQIRVEGSGARYRVSRGEQKLLAAALVLAQLQIILEAHGGTAALLMDDPAAELDAEALAKLTAALRALPVQLFVTALRADIPGLGAPGAVFHVKHGTIERQ